MVSGGIYNIRNMDSGKYLNVHYGVDANGTNVYQWSYDGSTEQKFKVVYSSSTDSYKIYAMCSSNGTNRVIDIARNGSPLASGQNVEIWTPVDNIAQQLQIEYLNHNYYVMRMKANTSMFIAVNGTSNGTGSGTSSTSAGNVYIDTYDVYRSQEWAFELVSYPSTVNPTGELEAVSEIGVSGWAWRSDAPNSPINVQVVIINSVTMRSKTYITTASSYRTDLYNSGIGDGYHGFYVPIVWTDFASGMYNVYAYGIGVNGALTLLDDCPISYNNVVNATLIGVFEEGYFHDHNQVLTDVKTKLQAQPFSHIYTNYSTFTSGNINSYLSDNKNAVFLYRGHGGIETDSYGNQIGTFLVINTTTQGSDYNSSSIPTNQDFSNIKVALFGACYSGQGGANALNLPSETVERGASCAVGFEGEIDCSATNMWTNSFFEYLSNGYSVYTACETLAEENIYRGTPFASYVLCGDGDTVLFPEQ